jgi:hypothetical protein
VTALIVFAMFPAVALIMAGLSRAERSLNEAEISQVQTTNQLTPAR